MQLDEKFFISYRKIGAEADEVLVSLHIPATNEVRDVLSSHRICLLCLYVRPVTMTITVTVIIYKYINT